jgi:hypothetical protein
LGDEIRDEGDVGGGDVATSIAQFHVHSENHCNE